MHQLLVISLSLSLSALGVVQTGPKQFSGSWDNGNGLWGYITMNNLTETHTHILIDIYIYIYIQKNLKNAQQQQSPSNQQLIIEQYRPTSRIMLNIKIPTHNNPSKMNLSSTTIDPLEVLNYTFVVDKVNIQNQTQVLLYMRFMAPSKSISIKKKFAN